MPVDVGRNFPDLGPRFARGELLARQRLAAAARAAPRKSSLAVAAAAAAGTTAPSDVKLAQQRLLPDEGLMVDGDITTDTRDITWSAVLKRTFEEYIRGERPNMYGEWISWD
jgi:WD repeat and SOF domain-containing protein 1